MTVLTVHFKKPENWDNIPYIHFWDADQQETSSHWPGEPMALEADGWFVFRFQASAANFVFNDGQGRQTDDLYRDQEGWLDEDGNWHDNGSEPAKVDASDPQLSEPVASESKQAVDLKTQILKKGVSMVNSLLQSYRRSK